MTERLRSGNSFVNSANISAKMSNDLTPRKTMLILVIVVGCFAVLWPKVFYPMLVGSANQHIKPSPIDKTTGCCDVISEIDVNTIKIMSELCRTIIKKDEDLPLTGREIVAKCQSAVLETCGIDISAVLQEQVRLGQSVKQILDEIRSLNGSLCLKYNFGVAPWTLGVPHRVTVKIPASNIRQERPMHLRSELVHPAFRERGRAIPQPQVTAAPRPAPRVVEGRPGPIPGMRPTLGGAGHVVPPPKQGTGSMGLIMPIYTIGIVIFFTYTVLKIIFKKQPEALYPPVEPDPNFRREVFESERSQAPKLTREGVSSKLGDAELDQLRQRLRETELAMERIVEQMAKVPLKLQNVVANGNVPQEEEQPSVKVLGMEMTASCEGGKKWSRPNSPVLPASPQAPQEPAEPPQEIFLEGALPAQSHLLVADSATEAEKTSSEEDPAVVLAGKMTLSVISLNSSENGTDESSNPDKRSSSNVSDEFEKVEVERVAEEPQNILDETRLLEQIENEIKEIDGKDIMTNIERTIELLQMQDSRLSDDIGIDSITDRTGLEFIEQEFDQKENDGKDILADIERTIGLLQMQDIQLPEDVELHPITDDTELESEFLEQESDQHDMNSLSSVDTVKEPATTESDVDKTEIIEQQSESKVGKESEEKSDVGKEPIADDVVEGTVETQIIEEEQGDKDQKFDVRKETITDDEIQGGVETKITEEEQENKDQKSNVGEQLIADDVNQRGVETQIIEEKQEDKDQKSNVGKETIADDEIQGGVKTKITEEKRGDKDQKSDEAKEPIPDDVVKGSVETQITEEKQENKDQNKIESGSLIQDEILSVVHPDNINVGRELELTQIDGIEEIPRHQQESEENIETPTPESPFPSNISESLLSGSVPESLVSSGISDSLFSSHLSEPPPNDVSEPLLSSNASESLSTSNISDILESNDVSFSNKVPEPENTLEEFSTDVDIERVIKEEESDTEEAKSKSVSANIIENQREVSENVEPSISTSAEEKEAFEKLNAAISELSSELRSGNDEKEDVIERLDETAGNDEEEIEYEHGDGDDEVIDEEVRNENRLDNELEDAGKVNGENHEHSKYGTTSSITLAEDEISDEDILADEVVDVQEIIEYITDDEEEIEYIIQPTHTNDANHMPEQPGAQ